MIVDGQNMIYVLGGGAAATLLLLLAAFTGDSEEQLVERGSFGRRAPSHTRSIMTSVDLMRAAAVWPLRSCISRAASAVMMEVMR